MSLLMFKDVSVRAKYGGCVCEYVSGVYMGRLVVVYHGKVHWKGVVVQTGMQSLFIMVYEVR